MRKTSNSNLSGAMRLLAASIKSDDGVANAAIYEAAQRLDDLAAIALEMLSMLPHRTAMPEGCPTCAIKARLAEMGIEA